MGLFGAIGSAVSDAGNFVGNVLTGGANVQAATTEATNAQNISATNATNAQQVALANSTYQRSVQDLRAAGLNPMLAYSGNTDPTPSLTAPQAQAPNTGAQYSNLFNSATSLGGLDLQRQSTESSVDLNHATSQMNQAKAEQAGANATESKVNTNLIQQNTEKAKADTMAASERANQEGMKTKLMRARFPTDSKLAGFDAISERVGQATGVVHDAISAFNPFSNYQKGYSKGSTTGYTSGYERGTRAGTAVGQ